MANNSSLRRNQLDDLLGALDIPPRPKRGWIAEIRDALMLTTTQLAKRLGVNQSSVSRLEQSEANSTITLASLERVAEVLNCSLKYVLVPRKPLEKIVFDRASIKLKEEDEQIQHTLALESQDDRENELEDIVRTAYLLEELGSKIWDDHD